MAKKIKTRCPQCGQVAAGTRSASDDRVRVECDCGHTFRVRVRTRQASSPAEPEDSQELPARRKRSTARTRRRQASKRSGPGIPVVIAGLFVMLLCGGAMWVWMSGTDIGNYVSVALDTPKKILEDANSCDVEVQELFTASDTQLSPEQLQDRVTALLHQSSQLVARAVLIEPITDNDVQRLIKPGDDEVEGPLSDSDVEDIFAAVKELPDDMRRRTSSATRKILDSLEFSRQYLQHGHLELTAGETPEFAVRRIALLREANQLAAKRILLTRADSDPADLSQPVSEEEAKIRLDERYAPIRDELQGLADQMHDLAEERYRQKSGRVKLSEQMDSVLYHTRQAMARLYPPALALIRLEPEIGKPLGEILAAADDIDAANQGVKPSRVLAREDEQHAKATRDREERSHIAEAEASFKALPASSESTNGGDGPVPTLTGRTPTESAMLDVARTFIAFARRNDHVAATEMIDVDQFHNRLHSNAGSYTAITKRISGAQLLKNFGEYALDHARVGGARQWNVIGVSEFEGSAGVVVRYFVEPEGPPEVFEDKELLKAIVPLVEFDQFAAASPSLLTPLPVKTSANDNRRNSNPGITKVNTPRAGYMMLVMDTESGPPKLIDLVNVVGNSPLSRTGAFVFTGDHLMHASLPGRTPETFGTRRSRAGLYGIVPYPDTTSWKSGDQEDEERAKAETAARTKEIEGLRPRRLEELMKAYKGDDAGFDRMLQSFRRDFPNDLGFEMAIVFHAMAFKEPHLPPERDHLIDEATARLHKKWNDPFFLYVRGLNAAAHGRDADAVNDFERCAQAGFETTRMHRSRLETAIAQSDQEAVVRVLQSMDRYWQSAGATPHDAQIADFKRQWKSIASEVAPKEKSNGMMAGRSQRMADSRMPAGLRARVAEMSGGAAGPRRVGPGSTDRTFPKGRPTAPPIEGPKVTIRITAESARGITTVIRAFLDKLEVRNHRFSMSGGSGTLVFAYAGSLQSVTDVIDFGTVQSTDETARTVELTVP